MGEAAAQKLIDLLNTPRAASHKDGGIYNASEEGDGVNRPPRYVESRGNID